MSCRVSVIVPVYNCVSFLSRAVESVVNQKNFFLDELILVDDGSTDGSADICDSYSDKYSNIKVIHQQNGGVSSARNAGIDIAQGDWIFFLDSDDYILPDAFERLLKFSDVDLISGKHLSNEPFSADTYYWFPEGVYSVERDKDRLNQVLIYRNTFYNCWSRLFRKDIIEAYNIRFPLNIKIAEDMVFVYSYLKHCKTFAFTDEEIYYYYVNPNNSTSVIHRSFDVFYYIYCWQKNYFSFDKSLQKHIDAVFVYKSFMSIKTSAFYMKGKAAISYLSEIVNNQVFYNCYLKEDYKKFSCKTDILFDRYIRNKKPEMLYLVILLCKLKSKMIKFIGG